MTVAADAGQHGSGPNFSILHQKLSLSLDLDEGTVQGVAKFSVKPLDETFRSFALNCRGLQMVSVAVQDEQVMDYTYRPPPQSIAELSLQNTEQLSETDELKYCNRWLRRLGTSQRELVIPISSDCLRLMETPASDATSETAPSTSYHPITVVIEYAIDPTCLNFGSISLHRSPASSPMRYVQLLGMSQNGMGRYLMPCLDETGERITNLDLEYSVHAGSWQDCFDRIHLVSTGVLCRQFVNDDRTVKVFHYKTQDIPIAPHQVAFVVGVLDAVKIAGAPFAYAFCPVSKAAKLTHCMEFFGKAFNFYNWFLNSGGTLRSLASLSSEVFPFPSYYVVFVRDLPRSLVSAANLSLVSSDMLHDASQIDQTFETRRVLCRALAEQYFSLRINLKHPQDAWIMRGIVQYLSELQLRTFHGNNDYRLNVKRDIARLVQLENTESLYVPPLASLAGYLHDHGAKLNPLDRARLEEILGLKSRLIFVLLERRIERTFLQRLLAHIYTESLHNRHKDGFSVLLFLKLVKRLTGKDLKSFTDQWIFNSGCPTFSLSFLHNRKKSTIDFELASRRPAAFKFSGNLTVRVFENEIAHEHVVHIDESTTRFEIPFHSRAKRPRKRKTSTAVAIEPSNDFDSNEENEDQGMEETPPATSTRKVTFAKPVSSAGKSSGQTAATSEQPQEDEESLDTLVSPISWIRIDPEMEWLSTFALSQPDIMWIEQLENDRDVVAQWEAARMLPEVSSTSESVCFALERFINEWKAFYAVRVEAIRSIALIGASLQESPVRLLGARKLIELFNKKFGHPNASLAVYPKSNNFDILPNYYLQLAIPGALSDAIVAVLNRTMDRPSEGATDFSPLEPLLAMFVSLLRHNDNATNAHADGEYLAQVIRAGTSAFARIQRVELAALRFRPLFDEFVQQLDRYAMLEHLLPSFRNAVMVAVLEAASVLHITDSEHLSVARLQTLLLPANFVLVRLETLRFFSVFFRTHGYSQDLFTLLQMIANDSSCEFRRRAINDPVFFEVAQYLLRSMDPAIEDAVRVWLLSRFTEDDVVLVSMLAVCAAIVGSASDDSSFVEAAAGMATAAIRSLKITFNIPTTSAAASSATHLDVERIVGGVEVNAAVASRDAADDDDVWLCELIGDAGRKTGRVISSGPDAVSSSTTGEPDERTKLQQVWHVLWTNYDSIPFRHPVDPSVPGYYAVIKSPMDLSTIKERLSTLPAFLMDLRQVFQNCFTFNQPDSLIYDQANRLRTLAITELRSVFPRDKKLIKQVLKTAQEDQEMLQRIERAVVPGGEDDVFVGTGMMTVPKVSKLAIKVATTTSRSLAIISSEQRQRMRSILQRLAKHPHAYFFMEPVDPVALNLPTYFDIVKHPMDLGTVRDRLPSYASLDDFAADVRLVFSNCRIFNHPETLVHQVAVEMERNFEADWTKLTGPASPKKKSEHAPVHSEPSTAPKIKLSLNLGALHRHHPPE